MITARTQHRTVTEPRQLVTANENNDSWCGTIMPRKFRVFKHSYMKLRSLKQAAQKSHLLSKTWSINPVCQQPTRRHRQIGQLRPFFQIDCNIYFRLYIFMLAWPFFVLFAHELACFVRLCILCVILLCHCLRKAYYSYWNKNNIRKPSAFGWWPGKSGLSTFYDLLILSDC